MKKIYLFSALLFASPVAYSQCSVVISGSSNVSCFGACDGSASTTMIGVPPATYAWAPGGQTIQNPTDLCPGTHTVTMIDANSCQATATVTITEPADLTLSSAGTNASCSGACDGSATVTPSGGVFPYTYSWAPSGSITNTAGGLCAGTHTCTVTDFNGCSKFTVITITEPAALTVVTSSNNVNCFGDCNAIAAATPSGGTPNYSYSWSNGCSTATCTNLCAGSHTVTVTDSMGCTAADTITISEPAELVVTTSKTDASCSGCFDGTASASPSGGTPGYSYMWSPGGQTSASIGGLGVGNYTVCVTDANQCVTCDTVTISAPSGISGQAETGGMAIYPNPVSEYLHVSSAIQGAVQISLYDITGKMHYLAGGYTYPGNTIRIPVDRLPSGLYFLEIGTEHGKSTHKIVRK
ncbi:MAG: fibronectin type III domain-containing protein [Bacteroidetes bacterium]|nr:MAG: fibronectin type III domain-containing protein [Bacteroidota bacterium]